MFPSFNPTRLPKRLMTTLTTTGAAIAIMTAAIPQTSFAQGEILVEGVYDGSKARVNLSAKLRSLSEGVAAATCRANEGVDTENALADLASMRSDYARILDALENGNPTLGVPTAEENPRNLRSLAALKELWAPLEDATGRIADGTVDPADVELIAKSHADLLAAAVILASDMSGHYSNPLELAQAEAITLSFIGRQRMLLNRMVRTSCGTLAGNDAFGTTDELQTTADVFDKSLIALRDGMADVGISPPPTDAVRNSLLETYGTWSDKASLVGDIVETGGTTADQLIEMAETAGDLSVGIDNTITLYLIASPGQSGIYKVPLEAYIETELNGWLENADLIAAVNAQNEAHAGLQQADIDALDQKWRAEAGGDGGELVDDLMGRPVSEWLVAQQEATTGLVTEVFVMDNKGLNVAQSAVTSDYWQGDEAKWQETYGNGSGEVHISEVEFDDSTGFYQTQASVPVTDPATGELIGAVTFGINVQSLM